MKALKKCFLIIFLSATGCSEYPPADKTTKIFSKYLEAEFNSTIPDSLHYYILVPQLTCQSCAASTLSELANNLRPEQNKKITFITTNQQLIPESLYTIPVLTDKNQTLDNLNLPIANVTLLETLNKKVIFVKPFYTHDSTSITSLIKNQ